MKIQPVIMSGGSGTRLWPLSRKTRPKQFLNLVSDKSLFQDTVMRLNDGGENFAPPLVICGRGHAQLVTDQLADIGVNAADIILEPGPRNTAAVAAVAAAWVAENNAGALALVAPADHHVEDAAGFRKSAMTGAEAAMNGAIVTFGIKPTHPHTGYGYIQSADEIGGGVYRVGSFREKPDAATAGDYLKTGGYYWNAGIFLYHPDAMLEAFAAHAPLIAEGAQKALNASAAENGARLLDEKLFSKTPSDSIDYAIMEKTDKAAVVAPVDVGWSDIGSWSEAATDPDGAGHIIVDSADVTLRSDGPVIGAVGVDNLIIVATGEAVLVARKDKAQEVRDLVEELKRRGREDLL